MSQPETKPNETTTERKQEQKPYRLADTPARDVPTGTPRLSTLAGQRLWITAIEWGENARGRYVDVHYGRRDDAGKAVFASARTASDKVMEQLEAASRQGSIWKADGGPGLSVYVCQRPSMPGMEPALYLSDEPPAEAPRQLPGKFGKRGE